MGGASGEVYALLQGLPSEQDGPPFKQVQGGTLGQQGQVQGLPALSA